MASDKPVPQAEFIGPMQPDPVTIAIPLRWVKVSHKSPEHIAARYPYAAFGSNLSIAQMAHRCPMADPVGTGLLRGARLVFANYLGIVEDSNATTLIGVYRLNSADVAALDRYEGLGRSYERYLVTVELNGEAVRCFTYIKRNNDPEAPSERYYVACLQGYADWGMDARRLRHARDYARKNEKPKAKQWPIRYGNTGKGFDFDDWYKATYPERNKANGATGTAGAGDDFIPEDTGRAPYQRRARPTDLPPHMMYDTSGKALEDRRAETTRRRQEAARRYEDMRPDEIREAIDNYDPARVCDMDADGRTVFVGRDGQRWIKSKGNVWRRAPKA